MIIDFKYEIGKEVIAESTEGKKTTAKINSLCFNGSENLYHISAPTFQQAWIKESELKERN